MGARVTSREPHPHHISVTLWGQVGIPKHPTFLLRTPWRKAGGHGGRCWATQGCSVDQWTSPVPSSSSHSSPLALPLPQCPGPAGAERELRWGQQKVHKSLLAKTSALSHGWRLLPMVQAKA